MAVSLGSFKSPLAETAFHSSRLDLLFKKIDLATQHLALLIHGAVVVDLGHEAPVVDGELVESSPKGGEGSAAPPQGR